MGERVRFGVLRIELVDEIADLVTTAPNREVIGVRTVPDQRVEHAAANPVGRSLGPFQPVAVNRLDAFQHRLAEKRGFAVFEQRTNRCVVRTHHHGSFEADVQLSLA